MKELLRESTPNNIPPSDICMEPNLEIKTSASSWDVPRKLTIEAGQANYSMGYGVLDGTAPIDSAPLEPAQIEELTTLCEEVVSDQSLKSEYGDYSNEPSVRIRFTDKEFLYKGIESSLPDSLRRVILFGDKVSKPLFEAKIDRMKSNPQS